MDAVKAHHAISRAWKKYLKSPKTEADHKKYVDTANKILKKVGGFKMKYFKESKKVLKK